MKIGKIIAIVASLSLIPLSIFSMEKKLSPTVFSLDIPEHEKREKRREYVQFYRNYKNSLTSKKITFLAKASQMPTKDILLLYNISQNDTKCLLQNIFDEHINKLQSKITNPKNPLLAKWKNLAKGVAAASMPVACAYYYLHNKKLADDVIRSDFVSRCANTASEYYYKAPYRPITKFIFDSGFKSKLGDTFGGLLSLAFQYGADHLTGFTHFFVPPAITISDMDIKSLIPIFLNLAQLALNGGNIGDAFFKIVFDMFIGPMPVRYSAHQFEKVWNYSEAYLLKK